MGAVSSRAKEVEALARYTEWTREQADALTNRYRALDLEFGLDMDSLSQLLEDDEAAGLVCTAFGRGNGTVNALEVLTAVCLCAQGTDDEIIKSCFMVFDFGGVGSTSYDEFAILVLVVARVLVTVVKAPKDSEPTDQAVDQIVRRKFSPKDRVEFEQCKKFVAEIFPLPADPPTEAGVAPTRTLEAMLRPFEIPMPADEAAELAALLGGPQPATAEADSAKPAADVDAAPAEASPAEAEAAPTDTAPAEAAPAEAAPAEAAPGEAAPAKAAPADAAPAEAEAAAAPTEAGAEAAPAEAAK